MRTSRSCVFPPGATIPPSRPKQWADRYAGQFDEGCMCARAHLARQKSWGDPADADAPSGTRIPLGLHAGASSSRCWPARWRCMPGLGHTDHHVGSDRGHRRPWISRTDRLTSSATTAVCEGTLNGAFTRWQLNGMARWRPPSSAVPIGRAGLAALATTTGRFVMAIDTPFQWNKQVPRTGAAPARHHRPLPGGSRRRGLRSRFPVMTSPRRSYSRGLPSGDGDGVMHRDGRHEHADSFDNAADRPTSCSTSRCSATVASTTRAGAR